MQFSEYIKCLIASLYFYTFFVKSFSKQLHKILQYPWGHPITQRLHSGLSLALKNKAFSHDVTAATLVFQNYETAARLVSQTCPVGVKLFSYVETYFCFNKFAWLLAS